MRPGASHSYKPSFWSGRVRSAHSREGLPRSDSPLEREADAAAQDWQIVVHLKLLFQRDPALLSTLFKDARCAQPAYATTLMLAANEALAAQPDSVDLLYHLAHAAAGTGKPKQAAELLERAVALNPGHGESVALLSDVRRGLSEANRPAGWLAHRLADGGKKQEASSKGSTEALPERKGQRRT